MNYENYKQFFDGGFFPIDSNHKLVNLANTGEFEVTATTGSGADTKTTKHWCNSEVGLTNMLRNYTGGSKFEALTQSQGHTFIPELADCTSYTGAQKAIVNHFEQMKKPLIIDLNYTDADSKSIALTFETDTNRVIEWGDGETFRGVDKAVNHQYAKKGNYRVKIYNWIDGQIKVQQTGFAHYLSPVHISILDGAKALFATKSDNEVNDIVYLNTNSAIDFTGVESLMFGYKSAETDDVPNMNSGLAEWVNLDEVADTLTELFLHCKNLYFDWKPLTFGDSFEIYLYPDEITTKTTLEYFANKAKVADGSKFYVTFQNAPGCETMFNYANEHYAGKFEDIYIDR